jgi:hypothetical protein
MNQVIANQFVKLLNRKLRALGYTDEQRARIVGNIGPNTILAWVKFYGPYPLGLVLHLVPLIEEREDPEGEPQPALEIWDEFNEYGRLRKPFDENDAIAALEPGDIPGPNPPKPPPPRPRRDVAAIDPPPRPRR